MGILIKLLSSGMGMASEAIHDYRARSHSRSGRDQFPPPVVPDTPVVPSSSRSPTPPSGTAPPEYVEVADEATADRLVRSGKAERVADHEDYDDDNDSSSSGDEDPDAAGANDEAAWELDDMAERVAPRSRAGSGTAAAAGEGEGESEPLSEEAKVKKEEQMIRDLLRMAGPPPPPPARRLPCPVIIPQRRPRNKDRGFVRAYAPVLDECGVGQDVFLKFLKDWLAATKVRRGVLRQRGRSRRRGRRRNEMQVTRH